jgi:hypothetical protein
VIKFVSDLRQVGGFFPGTPVSSTNKSDGIDNVDVYSDTLFDDFLETLIHSENITEKLFNTAKSKFPSTKLFLNENFVLNSSIHTTVSSRSIDNYFGFGNVQHTRSFTELLTSLL